MRSRLALPLLAGVAAIIVAFAGGASISDRSATTEGAMSGPNASTGVAAGDPPPRADAVRTAAGKRPRSTPPDVAGSPKTLRCAGCGVVESVRRIERWEPATGVCTSTEFEPSWIVGDARGHKRADVATLSAAVDGALAGRPGAGNMTVTSRYQTVVRFRDGSRHVFNEATPRALRPGERLLVIAGVPASAQ